jgi:hypothetical protein
VATARVPPTPAPICGYRTIGYPPIPESNFSVGDFSLREVNALFETHECALRRLEVQLVVPVLVLASSTFADQPKKEVHSQADLPRLSYPIKGSVSDLLQADESTFDSAIGKAATDIRFGL